MRAVNNEMVLAYWLIGREIVDGLQGGEARAAYGERLLDQLSRRLRGRYGRGFSVTNLRYFRTFHLVYSSRLPEIRHIAGGELEEKPWKLERGHLIADLEIAAAGRDRERGFSPELGWAHYRVLMQVDDRSERLFYEIEAERARWSVELLERQIHSLLFTRLIKSRDKRGVMELVQEGHRVRRPADALKDPYVLDFLDLPDSQQLRESDLEAAIIDRLQAFLLELGSGFAFVARQKRLTYDGDSFYVDLVFYHTVLKCYMLVDLKIGKLTHQDIGQMDSYVRLFDDQIRTEGDGPTVGLILCAEKNEAVVRYSILRENRQIFAAKYIKHLPSEAELKRELERERKQLGQRRVPKKPR